MGIGNRANASHHARPDFGRLVVLPPADGSALSQRHIAKRRNSCPRGSLSQLRHPHPSSMAKKNISNPSTTLSITAATSGSRSSISASETKADETRAVRDHIDETCQGHITYRRLLEQSVSCAHVDPTSASYSNHSSSSIIRSITPSPPCQNAGSRASRPKGASSSEWCLVPPAASI